MKKAINGLMDTFANFIYEGDRFTMKEHDGECCEHYIICEVKKDDISACGYGLYNIKTGKYLCNAAIANYPLETNYAYRETNK